MFTEADFEKLVCKVLSNNGWKYIPSEDLPRNYSDVLVESMVKNALIRLNPAWFCCYDSVFTITDFISTCSFSGH